MKKLKFSIFNNYSQCEDYLVIFNSLSKKMVKTDHIGLLTIFKNGDVTTCPKEVTKKFCECGFVVPADEDEIAKANLANCDHMYDKKLSLVIMPTEECNFRCKYCYESFPQGVISQSNQENLLRWMEKNVNCYERVEINWFGGEPLLVSGIITELSEKIIEICHKRGVLYSAAMTTNGYLLTAEMLRRMLKARIMVYQVTLDGLGEQHDQLRQRRDGGPTFDTIINNFRQIRDQIKSRTFSICIRTNISTPLMPVLEHYLAFLYHEFGNDKRFSMYFRPVGDWGGERVKGMKQDLIMDINKIYRKITDSGCRLNYTPYIQFLQDGMCSAGQRNSYVIRASGRINKCTMLLDHDENDIGFFSSKGEMELDYNKLAKWHSFTVSEDCNQCSKRPSCNERTCPAKHFLLDARGKCGYENQYMEAVLHLLSCADLIEKI